ncbi:hypothetical protein [Aliagarivorans taiwanensis]|uniref:hypothetical protein n=1 Tax=Aliagarivorans taiwanensis TaxID=561966 RepID=UPI00047A7CC6|nr:hypothetical protein [Aliagarivorans taiwanensis]
MTKNTVQSLWIGPSLSKIEQLSMRSFVHHGNPYHLYTYNDIDNVPDGVVVKDANEILPEREIFRDRSGSLGAFSDVFRFKLLESTSSFWVDTDVVCLKPYDFEESEVFGFQDDGSVNGAVLRLSKDSDVLREALDYCARPNVVRDYDSNKVKRRKLVRKIKRSGLSDISFGEIGPDLITKILKDKDLLATAKPIYYFYPIHHSCARTIFSENGKEMASFLEHSYSLHLWNEIFRREGIDKNGDFSANSLIGALMKRYAG